MTCSPIIVPCEACGSEGRIYHVVGYDRATGSPQEFDEPCPYCNGTGGEEVEGQPITLEDATAIGESLR